MIFKEIELELKTKIGTKSHSIMSLVRRHVAKKSKKPTTTPLSDFQTCSAFRIVTRAQEANPMSIRVPDPIAMHNSYSTLNDTIMSDSSTDLDEYTWKSAESTSDSVESNADDSDRSPQNESNDGGDEYSDTDYSDMPPLIDESMESGESTESTESDQEIIVNHQRYQRVQKSYKDSLPCPITISFTLWAIAIYMQLIFQLCGLTNDKCSRTL
jgi:hypothetical protein